MKATYNAKENCFDVTITKEDLKDAFASEDAYYTFLRNIVVHTHGEHVANILFPIEKGEQPNDN